MAITLSNLFTNLNTYLGDSSTDRVSDAERYQALTEATVWLLEELGNEHMVNTYTLDYLDGVHYYKTTAALADLLVGADLRLGQNDHTLSFTRKSPREIAEEIGQGVNDPSWAVERKDGDSYLVINFDSKYLPVEISGFDSVTDGGTWTVEDDAVNITQDTSEYKYGSASLNFDVDVSASGNNYATVYAADSTTRDLSELEDTSSFVFEVYIPDVTYTSSLSLFWGSDTAATPSTKSNYWSATVTTDINGNSLVSGWNTIKVNWSDASVTGSPDVTSIKYYEFRITYTGSQGDDTDYRLDKFRLIKPEEVVFHYISWNIGIDNGGTNITAYTAATDVPFYSGQYDQYRYAVAHKAASILYYSALRLPQQGAVEESEAMKSLMRYRENFESSKSREVKSFKVRGVNLRLGNRRRNPRFRN